MILNLVANFLQSRQPMSLDSFRVRTPIQAGQQAYLSLLVDSLVIDILRHWSD